MGDRYLRRLLVVGMTSLVRRAKATPTSVDRTPSVKAAVWSGWGCQAAI
jgi:hypothetical protein